MADIVGRPRPPHVDANKRGLEPAPNCTTGLTPLLLAIHASWPSAFASKVNISDTCWEWNRSTSSHGGYGRYTIPGGKGRWVVAHRYAYELAHGPIPDGLNLDHLCRNPKCVRPDHLEPVTQETNVNRGASANVVGKCRAGLHDWTPENIINGPARARQPNGVRRCRPCAQELERNRVRRAPMPQDQAMRHA